MKKSFGFVVSFLVVLAGFGLSSCQKKADTMSQVSNENTSSQSEHANEQVQPVSEGVNPQPSVENTQLQPSVETSKLETEPKTAVLPVTRKMLNEALKNQSDISKFDVSNVTDMSSMFKEATSFNQLIGDWNVSNVTNMDSMFYEAKSFNQPIGDWNVSNVKEMRSMFEEATSFNQPIGNWNVGNVTDMSKMFYNAEAFNQPIGDWNVSNVTNMYEMFYEAKSFNQDLSRWDVSHVEYADEMFKGSGLSQENYCKMITTDDGWKRLNEKFNLGILYRCNGVYMGAVANCFVESLSENIRNQWHINENGEWICETGRCEFCNELYRGNVHIENNRVMCAHNSSAPNVYCYDNTFLDKSRIEFDQFTQRHKVNVTAGKDVTWKSIEDKFTLPLLKADSKEEIATKLVNHLDRKKCEFEKTYSNTCTYKNTCLLVGKTITFEDGLILQMIACGGYDTEFDDEKPTPGTRLEENNWLGRKSVSDIYFSITSPKDQQTRVFEGLSSVLLDDPGVESNNGSGDYRLVGIMSAPFLDTVGYYVRFETNNSYDFEHGGGGGDSTETTYSTLLFAGDKTRFIAKWNDTEYSSGYYTGSDYEEFKHTYDEITANFDGKEFTFSKIKITTRKEFLDHQARQILAEKAKTQEIMASPKSEETPDTPQK